MMMILMTIKYNVSSDNDWLPLGAAVCVYVFAPFVCPTFYSLNFLEMK